MGARMWYSIVTGREHPPYRKEPDTMKIYHLAITAYDYWFACDRDGFITVDK